MVNPFVYAANQPPAIMLKLSQLYRRGVSGARLYDITRGVWNVNIRRASQVKFAFAVGGGQIVEVFEIHAWHPANSTPYPSGRQDQSAPKYAKRFEFTGTVAAAAIRNRYLGQSVVFPRGRQELRYFNC
jgi:hypothetical protein